MRIKPTTDGTWLRLERIDAREFEIESLSEPETEPELPMAAIKGPTERIERHIVETIRPRLLRRL